MLLLFQVRRTPKALEPERPGPQTTTADMENMNRKQKKPNKTEQVPTKTYYGPDIHSQASQIQTSAPKLRKDEKAFTVQPYSPLRFVSQIPNPLPTQAQP